MRVIFVSFLDELLQPEVPLYTRHIHLYSVEQEALTVKLLHYR